ncbi:MAG: hypothetical protein ACRC1F_00045 [Metamycoplasmataceae bacterium]
MKQMKKIKLGAISGGSLIVPLILVASCSSTSILDNYKITAKTNPETIYESDVKGDRLNTVETLSLMFDGINATNIKNITATLIPIDTRAKEHKIRLTANEGYTINDKKEWDSTVFTPQPSTIIEIEQQKTAPTNISFTDIENDGYKNINVLEKLFTNIKEADKANLEDISLSGDTPTPGSTHKVTLTAKRGFAFKVDNKEVSKLESVEFTTVLIDLNITDIEPVNPILNTDIEGENYKSIATLKKLFSGNDDDFANVNIKLENPVNSPKNIIILTAKPGYSINGAESLPSREFDVKMALYIKPVATVPSDINFVDIKDGKYMDIAILKRLFDGIEETDKENMTITMTNEAGSGLHKMTLAAKGNFVFLDDDGKESKEISVEFTSKDITLNITRITDLSSVLVLEKEIVPEKLQSKETLSKLFNGITDDNIDVITASVLSVTGGRQVELKLETGYLFSNTTSTLQSSEFVLGLEIRPVTTAPTDITFLGLVNDGHKRPMILVKLFNGIEANHIDKNLTVEITPLSATGAGVHTITLTKKDGNVFVDENGNKSDQISMTFTSVNVNLAISRIENPGPIYTHEVDNNNYKDPAVLAVLFRGINLHLNVLEEPTLIRNTVGGTIYKVRLKTKVGFSIENQTEFDSAEFTPVAPRNLMIDKGTTPPNDLPASDFPNNTVNIDVARKFFTGIDEAKFENIEATLVANNDGTHKIKLKAKRGHILGISPLAQPITELESDNFTLTN